jgi:hypothetical protein
MFPLKYLERHLFMEQEDRLYLVDTGCPRSFAINHAVPWANKTPHSVILDMRKGQLRFTWRYDEDPCEGTAHPFTKASGTKAPIFRCRPESKMIWDTGAQIGYVDMSTVPPKNIIEEMGAFVDFSPIYGPIESPMTWLVRFDLLPTPDMGPIEWAPYIHCRMADAPKRIITDIRRGEADGVLGNDWMVDRDGVIITIKGQESVAYIKGIPFEPHPTYMDTFGGWKKPRRNDILKILDDPDHPQHPSDAAIPDIKDTERQERPDPNDMLTPVMRNVPSSLGAFTTEGLRSHIGMENIYGLIGNDLLMDTIL